MALKRPSAEQLALLILLLTFSVLAAGYSIAAPLGEAPDEVGHFAYVEYLLKYQRLPSGTGEASGEAKQPPLYYMLGAFVSSFVPRDDYRVIANPDFSLSDPQVPNLLLHTRMEAFPYEGTALAWHIVRLLSVALGAITVWATWRIGMELLAAPWVSLAGAAFVAFLPEFLFVSGAANNDNLVTALSSLAILQSIRMCKRGVTTRSALVLGLLLGLAAFAKLSGLVVWLFALVPFVWALRERAKWRGLVFSFAACFGLAALVIAPWLVNNLVAYGDPFAWGLVTAVSDVRQGPMAFGDWLTLGENLLWSAGGRFGGASHIPALPAGYAGLALLVLLALLGWILYAWDAVRRSFLQEVLQLLVLFAVFWGILLAALVRWTLTALGTDQSRLLFPGISLLALVLAAGISRLFQSRREWALQTWSLALFAIGGVSLIFLWTIYAPPSRIEPVQPAASSVAAFGDTIRLINYDAPTEAAPGESLVVQLEWQALGETPEDYWILLQLGQNGVTAANKDGVPGAGRLTTDWWQVGEVVGGHHTFTLPADIKAGTYDLKVGLHPFGRWEWLKTGGSDMLVLGKLTVRAKQ